MPPQQPEQSAHPLDPDAYVEAVLSLVERIPAGRVMTYGMIADEVGQHGPRSVGRVMSHHGGAVPWWRVVRADGGLPLADEGESRARHLDEGTPLRASGRVELAAAVWWPGVAGPGGVAPTIPRDVGPG